MALCEVYNGKRTAIMHSEGALGIKNPPSYLSVSRKFYKVPYSNIGIGSIIESNGKTYHVPSWTEVHPKTRIEDILVEKKPFDELFVKPESWTFESASSDKVYTVKRNRNGELACDCWGYIGHRKCKHINEVKASL